jgi:hypothetical protein
MFGLTEKMTKIVASVVVAGGLVGACVIRDGRIEERGATKVVDAGKKAGAEANAKNIKVRDRARAPGAAERLRAEVCRDCN